MVNTPGQRLTSPVAHFRLDKREEVTIKWYMLSCDTIVIIIGESTVLAIALTFRTFSNNNFRGHFSNVAGYPSKTNGPIHQYGCWTRTGNWWTRFALRYARTGTYFSLNSSSKKKESKKIFKKTII